LQTQLVCKYYLKKESTMLEAYFKDIEALLSKPIHEACQEKCNMGAFEPPMPVAPTSDVLTAEPMEAPQAPFEAPKCAPSGLQIETVAQVTPKNTPLSPQEEIYTYTREARISDDCKKIFIEGEQYPFPIPIWYSRAGLKMRNRKEIDKVLRHYNFNHLEFKIVEGV
jgi:hypothetical protein